MQECKSVAVSAASCYHSSGGPGRDGRLAEFLPGMDIRYVYLHHRNGDGFYRVGYRQGIVGVSPGIYYDAACVLVKSETLDGVDYLSFGVRLKI